MNIILVGAGSALGGIFRYCVDTGMIAYFNFNAYASIAVINLLGSFLIGWILVQTKQISNTWYFWGIGFCGGFTTFASFSHLLHEGVFNFDPKAICAYAIGLIFGGMFCFVLGAFLAKKFN